MTAPRAPERLPASRHIRSLYEALLGHYGPQGWWPVLSRAGEAGYDDRGYHPGLYPAVREDGAAFFDVLCGAVLTQNTAWRNAEAALKSMRRRGIDSLEKITAAEDEYLAATIRSSGYYNQKARKLKSLAEALADFPTRPDGRNKGRPEKSSKILREDLLGVWGLGPETADSILLYAFDSPFFVIDAYTRRMMERVFGVTDIPRGNRGYDYLQDVFHSALPHNTEVYGEYHALIVRHCKEACTVRPRCIGCMLTARCLYYRGSAE